MWHKLFGLFALILLVSLLATRGAVAAEDAPVAQADAAEQPDDANDEQTGAGEAAAEEQPASDAAEDEKPKHKYIRVSLNDDEKPVSLDTSVITFTPQGEKHQGVTVELVGAIHVGDAKYYEDLNKLFESYDVLLYELVAPEGTRVPKGGRKEVGSAIGALQGGMSSLLALEHQLEKVDYTKDNFVHADMSPEEFAKSMSDRGESFFQMFLKALGQSTVQPPKGSSRVSDTDILFALFAKDRATRLKTLLAGQFSDMESQMSIFNGPEGSTIITERNKKCFEVLAKELEKGHKRIGVFYGAGHLPDMEQRLADDFGMQRSAEKWLVAWDLKAQPKAEKPAPEKPAEDAVPVEEAPAQSEPLKKAG